MTVRSVAAPLIAAASLVALVLPAGAATPKVTWEHQTLPCAKGQKSATVTLK
jgi:hypothetical protein